jgi:ribosomal protein S18 acetylase RimI-like enzyme
MDYSFEMCYHYGEVVFSDQFDACAMILYPQKVSTSVKTLWLNVRLLARAIGWKGIFKVIDREAKIKSRKPDIPMVYLWFIGVSPKMQGRGKGSALLAAIMEQSAKIQLPLYLETSTARNLPWYDRFDFKIYDRLDLSYSLFFLKNDLK